MLHISVNMLRITFTKQNRILVTHNIKLTFSPRHVNDRVQSHFTPTLAKEHPRSLLPPTGGRGRVMPSLAVSYHKQDSSQFCQSHTCNFFTTYV
jgi:hypothetical protein